MFRAEDRSVKIAEKSIICYKRVNPQKIGYVTSFLMGFTYKLGKIYEIGDEGWEITRENVVESGVAMIGFHSYKKGSSYMSMSKNQVIATSIIPKGAEYYENEFGYISNSIVVNKITNNF